LPPAAGGSWAKQSLVLVLTRMKKSVDRYIYSASCYSQSLHTFSRRHSTLRNGMLGWPCVPVCSAGLQASTAENWTEHLLDQLWSSGGVSNFGSSAGATQAHLLGLATSKCAYSFCWTGATPSSRLELLRNPTALLFRAGAS
jgi:hypothetical protein